MLEIKALNIEVSNKKILQDLSFSADTGDIIALVGLNGAGKTTTIRAICGIITPKSGEIIVGGKNIAKERIEAQKGIGLLLENSPLYEEMTPREYLEFMAQIRDIPKANMRDAIGKIAETLNLQAVFHQIIATLSKGFKRRIGLAAALLHNPKILILDEPTDGLDPIQRENLLKNIKQMADERVILISTHNINDIEAICNRIIILKSGQKIYDGDLAVFKNRHEKIGASVFAEGVNE